MAPLGWQEELLLLHRVGALDSEQLRSGCTQCQAPVRGRPSLSPRGFNLGGSTQGEGANHSRTSIVEPRVGRLNETLEPGHAKQVSHARSPGCFWKKLPGHTSVHKLELELRKLGPQLPWHAWRISLGRAALAPPASGDTD